VTTNNEKKKESVLKMKRASIYVKKVFASLAYTIRFRFFFTFSYRCARLILMQSFLFVSFLFFRAFMLSTFLSHSHASYIWVLISFFFLVLFLHIQYDGDTQQNLSKRRKNVCVYIIIHSSRQRTFGFVFFLLIQG